MNKIFIFVCFIISISFCKAQAEQLVFNGLPISKVSSSSKETTRELLDDSKKNEFRLLISKRGDKYFWTSRENQPLFHVISGAFHIFTEKQGSGYIKIFDSSFIQDSMSGPGPRYSYMEHLHMHLGTITYWGTSETFNP